MKEKVIGIFAGALASFLILTACGSNSSALRASTVDTTKSTFMILEHGEISAYTDYYILVDKDTNIMYCLYESRNMTNGDVSTTVTPLFTNNVGNGIDLKNYK